MNNEKPCTEYTVRQATPEDYRNGVILQHKISGTKCRILSHYGRDEYESAVEEVFVPITQSSRDAKEFNVLTPIKSKLDKDIAALKLQLTKAINSRRTFDLLTKHEPDKLHLPNGVV
jgi:hypothetical protein